MRDIVVMINKKDQDIFARQHKTFVFAINTEDIGLALCVDIEFLVVSRLVIDQMLFGVDVIIGINISMYRNCL
jgi:hypothetical protein